MTREEALEVFSTVKERSEHFKECGCRFPLWTITERDEEAIGVAIKVLSADAVQGEWKHTTTGQPYCSNCEYVFGEDEEFSPFWDYCPMCGAKIKGGDSE